MTLLIRDYVMLCIWISVVFSQNQTSNNESRIGRHVITGAIIKGKCQGSVEIRHFGTKQIIHRHITESRVLSLQKDEKWEIRKLGNCCHNLHTKKKCHGYFYRIGNQWSQITPRWDELSLVTLDPGSRSSCNSMSRRQSRLGCPQNIITKPLKILNTNNQTINLSSSTSPSTTQLISSTVSVSPTSTTPGTTTSTITPMIKTTTTTSTILISISTTTPIPIATMKSTTTLTPMTITTSTTTSVSMTTTTTTLIPMTTTTPVSMTTTTLTPMTKEPNKKCHGFVEIRDYQTKKMIKSKVSYSQVLSIQKDRDRVLKNLEVRTFGNCCFNLHTKEGCKGKFYRLKRGWTLISSKWDELTLVNIDPTDVNQDITSDLSSGLRCKAITKRQSRKNCPKTSSTTTKVTTKTMPSTSTESSTNRTITTNTEPANPLINMFMQWGKNTINVIRNIKVVRTI